MFNLCKTVKIYQTINHYHITNSPANHLVDSHELRFEEDSPPSQSAQSHGLSIQTIETHSLVPRRTGISLSIKGTLQKYSPSSKKISLTKPKAGHLRANSSNSSCAESFKLRTTLREQCASPKIVESKITWGSMSPKVQAYQSPIQAKFFLDQQELALLTQIPLRKVTTTTTHASVARQSQRVSDAKIDVEFSPLKRSSCFLRKSTKSRIEENMRSSLNESLKNSLDLKLNNSKYRKEDASESLLKLSCSSYSNILDYPNPYYNYEQFSQTCSLELKKEQSFLKDYANDVSQSIIFARIIPEKQMKNVRSNYDLLTTDALSRQDFKPTQSNIIERKGESPRRENKKYGDNMLNLNIYDRETIVSKSIASKSNRQGEQAPVIDESIIIKHHIEDKFRPLNGKIVSRQDWRMFLAVEEGASLLVSIKEIPLEWMERINEELSVYRNVEQHSIQVALSKLYQVYTHEDRYIIVKEPYQYTFEEFLRKYYDDFTFSSWEIIIQGIQQALKKTVANLAAKGIHLCRFISIQDLVFVLGEWKLHSPHMFSVCETEETSIPVVQAMGFLREEMMGLIEERKSPRK